VYLLLYHRKEEFRLLWNKAIELLNKKLHRAEKGIAALTQEEQILFALLRGHLTGKEAEAIDSCPEAIDWEKLDKLATNHAVLPFMADMFAELPMPRYLKLRAERVAMTAAKQNYRFLMMDKYLTGILAEQGVEVVILKGVSTGSLYPVQELRKTGDVDLLLCDKGQIEKACEVLKAAGFEMTEYQPSLHHVVFESEEGFDIELHSMLAEPFDNNYMNQYMDTCLGTCKDNILRKEILGVELPVLADAYHAFELLLHMLQHYLRKGFGLKLLCDWVVFWNRDTSEEEKEKYLRLVKESGTKGFSDMVTLACCRYLGLSEQKTEWMELTQGNTELFMREILEAEEFGKSSKDRMVALRGNSLFDYIREFHHQMCLNWPKANKIVILWPFLWVHTLVRFLVNNRSLRKVSTMDIMRKAGQRGELIRKMKLFERK
ncbi:MAG: nucleotidyltransferase family protein, partial [Acetatifactor sp.]|nr:nucleotidyltransferase family protein [Acetatifactor sp.]